MAQEKGEEPDKTGVTTRRDALKATAALGVGAIATPMISGSATAAEAPQEWEHTENYENYSGFNVTHSSGLRLEKSMILDDGWQYDFVAAGHCVTAKDGDKEADIFSNVMIIDEQNSCLETYAGMDAQTKGMLPKPDGGDNTDAVDLSLDVLELVADAVGSTAGVAALTATQLLEGILNTFTDTSGGMPVKWEGSYSNQNGVSEAAHHWDFIIKETQCSDWSPSMTITSKLGKSQIQWTITFSLSTVSAGTSSLQTTQDEPEWGHPSTMSKEERDHFGIRRISPDMVDDVNLEDNPEKQKFTVQIGNEEVMMRRSEIERIKEEGPAWIATNPPVAAEVSHTVVE